MCLVKALRDIKKGEEVCLSYMDFNDSRWIRQIKLREHNFECQCVRCAEVGEWKEKVRQIEGFKCQKCGVVISPDLKGDFNCPKGCFSITRFKVEYRISDIVTALEFLSPFAEKKGNGMVPEDLDEDVQDILEEKKKKGAIAALEQLWGMWMRGLGRGTR